MQSRVDWRLISHLCINRVVFFFCPRVRVFIVIALRVKRPHGVFSLHLTIIQYTRFRTTTKKRCVNFFRAWRQRKLTHSHSAIKRHLRGLIIQHTKLQTHTNIHAPTASHVATGPESALYRELSTFPWWACRPCGPGRCRDEVGAKIDCKCWIIQPSPPPFEWVSSVTFRRAFIAKQEKIIFHRPPWRPWTPLINETKHLQPRHTDTDTLTQIHTHAHTHVDRHAETTGDIDISYLYTYTGQLPKHTDPLHRLT